MWAWQFMEYNMIARMNGWTEFISMQNFYAASYRNEEQEMLPCCKKLGVGVIPWSPLAVSRLKDWLSFRADPGCCRADC